jgi:hypothetical protein
MPDTYIKDDIPTREGDFSIRSQGGLPVIDETYSWIVVAESELVPYLTVVNTPGLPIVNGTVSPFGLGVCRSKKGKRWTQNAKYWTVTCEFSSAVDESANSNIQDPSVDPVAWVPVYETKFERLQEIVTTDKAGETIANSLGMPFSTGMTINRFIPVWEFYQIENPDPDEAIVERMERVNEFEFKGKEPKTLLCIILSSVVGFYYGQRRRLTHYSVKYNRKKWTHKRLDTGPAYLDGTNLVPYTDKFGNVINGGLDGEGGKVDVGESPAVLEFEYYDETNFNTFLRI